MAPAEIQLERNPLRMHTTARDEGSALRQAEGSGTAFGRAEAQAKESRFVAGEGGA